MTTEYITPAICNVYLDGKCSNDKCSHSKLHEYNNPYSVYDKLSNTESKCVSICNILNKEKNEQIQLIRHCVHREDSTEEVTDIITMIEKEG